MLTAAAIGTRTKSGLNHGYLPKVTKSLGEVPLANIKFSDVAGTRAKTQLADLVVSVVNGLSGGDPLALLSAVREKLSKGPLLGNQALEIEKATQNSLLKSLVDCMVTFVKPLPEVEEIDDKDAFEQDGAVAKSHVGVQNLSHVDQQSVRILRTVFVNSGMPYSELEKIRCPPSILPRRTFFKLQKQLTNETLEQVLMNQDKGRKTAIETHPELVQEFREFYSNEENSILSNTLPSRNMTFGEPRH